MVVREVRLMGDPLLREVSQEVKPEDSELHGVMEDLRDTLTELQRVHGLGRGIAAPQIGCLKRLVYIQTEGFRDYLVNPRIVWRSQEEFMVWDSCFSLDVAFFVRVPRSRRVRVSFTDGEGRLRLEEFSDGLSELVQHELDHLDGVLCVDRVRDPREMAMRKEWEKRYRTPGIGM